MLALLSLSGGFCIALHIILITREMRRNPHYTPAVALACSQFIAGAILLIPLLIQSSSFPLSFLAFKCILVTVFASIISKWLYLYAYSKIDVAFITPFSALTPLFSVVTGWYVLNELPSRTEILGISITCLAIYLMFLKRDTSRRLIHTLLSPFTYIASSIPALCAFLSVFPPAISIPFEKKSILLLDPLTYASFASVLVGIGALILLIPERIYQGKKGSVKGLNPYSLFGQVGSLVGAQILIGYAMLQSEAASIAGLQRVSMVFQIVIAYYLLDQKQDFHRRLLLSTLIILGFMITVHGSSHP